MSPPQHPHDADAFHTFCEWLSEQYHPRPTNQGVPHPTGSSAGLLMAGATLTMVGVASVVGWDQIARYVAGRLSAHTLNLLRHVWDDSTLRGWFGTWFDQFMAAEATVLSHLRPPPSQQQAAAAPPGPTVVEVREAVINKGGLHRDEFRAAAQAHVERARRFRRERDPLLAAHDLAMSLPQVSAHALAILLAVMVGLATFVGRSRRPKFRTASSDNDSQSSLPVAVLTTPVNWLFDLFLGLGMAITSLSGSDPDYTYHHVTHVLHTLCAWELLVHSLEVYGADLVLLVVDGLAYIFGERGVA